MINELTVLILTFNEVSNIGRVIERLKWVKSILVVDSYSTDGTLEILKKYPQVTVLQRKFDSFANQCNFGLKQLTSPWVLSIDSDYILSDELINEIKGLRRDAVISGFSAKFKYCIFGKPLRGSLLPPRILLFKKSDGTYIDDGHAHFVRVKGEVRLLSSFVYHDDRKPLKRWLEAQDKYLEIEADKIINHSWVSLNGADRIRKTLFIAPAAVFFYCLFYKKLIFDGWRGWYYAFQRMLAEVILSLHLIERMILRKAKNIKSEEKL